MVVYLKGTEATKHKTPMSLFMIYFEYCARRPYLMEKTPVWEHFYCDVILCFSEINSIDLIGESVTLSKDFR